MSIIVLIEILILCTGGTLYSFRTGEKLSESIAKGLFSSLLILSFSFQLSFLLGQPKISFFIEIIITGFSLYIIKIKISQFKKALIIIKYFFLKYKFTVAFLLIVWTYLFLQAVLLPPSNWDSMTYNLARVLLFQQEKSLFLTEVSIPGQAIFPVGADILHHSLLRFYDDYGIGIFSFIAYLIICFATYALARKYANPQHSLVATLVIASLPELVLQSTSTKPDIFIAATAVFCFILIHRILTSINLEDLILLPIVLCFGISCKTNFMGFALPFVVFFSVLFFQKYSWRYLLKILKQHKLSFLLGILPILVFFPWFAFYHNHTHFGLWSGSVQLVTLIKQKDGIMGTLANLVRYLFQWIDFLEPLELIFQEITGKIFNHQGGTITDLLIGFYNQVFDPLFGDKGIMKGDFSMINNNNGYPFFIIRSNGEDYSWFGPFGFFLVIPSLIFALVKGDLYLKAVSLTIIAYGLIICNQIAWFPWVNRYFSLFFASSGVLIAYLFAQAKLNKFFSRLLTFFAITILIYVSTFNMGKPLMKYPHEKITLSQFNPRLWAEAVTQKGIWSLTNLGTNRTFYFDAGGFPPVNILSQFIPDASEVALITTSDTWVYQYFLYNPQLKITPFEFSRTDLLEKTYNSGKFDYIFCLDTSCDSFKNINNTKVLWSSSNEKGRKGTIVKLPDRVIQYKQ